MSEHADAPFLTPDSAVAVEARPWPHGLPEAATLDPDAPPLAYLNPTELLTLTDIYSATKLLLYRTQAHLNVSWRTDHWYDEHDVRDSIGTWLEHAPMRAHHHPSNRHGAPLAVTNTDSALEVLLYAFTLPPKQVIYSLNAMGVNAKTAIPEDYYVAFTLLDHTDWFTLLRDAAIPVHRVPGLQASLGERFALFLRLDWTYEHLTAASADPARTATDYPLDALRTMVALR